MANPVNSMKLRNTLLAILVIAPPLFAQEPAGDSGRFISDQEAKSKPATKILTDEDSGPAAIRAGEDPLQVFQRARARFLRDSSHRCREESSGKSGPGWRKSEIYEVEGADRMRIQVEDGSKRSEWLLVGGTFYFKEDGMAWRRITSEQEVFQARFNFSTLIPQELNFGFKAGDLKQVGSQVVGGVRVVIYQFTGDTVDMDRTISFWLGKRDSLPYRVDMRTVSKERFSPVTTWYESTTCTYGIRVEIEAPI